MLIIQGQHSNFGPGFDKYNACAHEEDEEVKPYIQPGEKNLNCFKNIQYGQWGYIIDITLELYQLIF